MITTGQKTRQLRQLLLASALATPFMFSAAWAKESPKPAAEAATAVSAPTESKAKESELNNIMSAIEKQGRELEAQQQAILDQQEKLQQQQEQLHQQKARYAELKHRLKQATGDQSVDTSDYDSLSPAAGPSEQAESGTPEHVGTDRAPKPPEKPPEVTALYEQGGVLLRKGRAVFTPSLEYSRSSATRVAIEGFSIIPALNIGTFEISEIGRDTITAAASGRIGLTNRLEVDAKIPYLYRSDATRTRPVGVGTSSDTLTEVDALDIGDAELGAHYQINRGLNGWPYFIGNMRFKLRTGTDPFEVPTDPTTGLATELPTGSGFYAIQPSVTAIYPTDPVVFFANLGYLHNFPRSFGGTVGEIAPGDSISFAFGMNLALNDDSSFSVGYGHDVVMETEQNGEKLANSTMLQVGSLDFGYSHAISDRVSVNLNVSAGVTEDAPDSRITLRVPIAFELFK